MEGENHQALFADIATKMYDQPFTINSIETKSPIIHSPDTGQLAMMMPLVQYSPDQVLLRPSLKAKQHQALFADIATKMYDQPFTINSIETKSPIIHSPDTGQLAMMMPPRIIETSPPKSGQIQFLTARI